MILKIGAIALGVVGLIGLGAIGLQHPSIGLISQIYVYGILGYSIFVNFVAIK